MTVVAYQALSETERAPIYKCGMCGALCDGCIQHETTAGWVPDPAPTLKALGWIDSTMGWFCGRLCQENYAYAMSRTHKGAPVQAVKEIADASYQAARAKAKAR